MTRETGTIVSVEVMRNGGTLTTAHAAGATVLQLDTSVDFDDDGGRVLVDDVAYDYTSADDDADTITLATGLATSLLEGERAFVLDAAGNVEVEWYVNVDTEDGEPIPAEVDDALRPYFPELDEDIIGQSVTIADDEQGNWHAVSRPGQETFIASEAVLTPFLSAHLGGNQSIPNNTGTNLTVGWVIDEVSTDVILPSLTIPGQINCNRDGIYQAVIRTKWESNGTGRRVVAPSWQTFVGAVSGPSKSAGTEAIVGFTVDMSHSKRLKAGEGLMVSVSQSSGGNLNVLGGNSEPRCSIEVYYLGP